MELRKISLLADLKTMISEHEMKMEKIAMTNVYGKTAVKLMLKQAYRHGVEDTCKKMKELLEST